MTFDEQVAELRGKVEAKSFTGRKCDATPEQWAGRLDYHAAYRTSHRDDHRVRGRANQALYRSRHPEAVRAQKSSHYFKNVADERRKQKHYRGVSLHARRSYESARRASDLPFRLRKTLRSRLADSLQGRRKSGSAVRDLGCSVADLKAHLERQFLPGMTWDNWGAGEGKWQIDHIYPLAKADLTVRLVVLAVCNWRNLQPLWFKDNNRKGDTVTPEAQQLFDGLVSEFTDNEGGE
jgi:hypothetical protein